MKSLKGKFIVISSIRVVECIDYDSDYDRVLLKSSSGEMFLRDIRRQGGSSELRHDARGWCRYDCSEEGWFLASIIPGWT
jgi:hypothetical protein